MLIKLEYERKKREALEKERKKAIRRYLRDISACLPCKYRQKKRILEDIHGLINNRSRMLYSRAELEKEIGTPESIVQLYLDENAVPLLRRSMRGRRIGFIAAAVLLLFLVIVLGFTLTSPPGHYTEDIEILDNGFETILLQEDGFEQIYLLRRASKTVTYYDHRNNKIWSMTATGDFAYTYGITSKAVTADSEIALYDPAAISISEEHNLAGNAIVTVGTVDYNGLTLLKKITLTCDRYGKLS